MTVKHSTLAPNFNQVDFGNYSLYFSYETLIAFRYEGEEFISENVWTRTTEKHLNMISQKGERMTHSEFKKAVKMYIQ